VVRLRSTTATRTHQERTTFCRPHLRRSATAPVSSYWSVGSTMATGSCPEAGSRSANPSAKPLSVKSPESPALLFCSQKEEHRHGDGECLDRADG
jgi:hypothetical protein